MLPEGSPVTGVGMRRSPHGGLAPLRRLTGRRTESCARPAGAQSLQVVFPAAVLEALRTQSTAALLGIQAVFPGQNLGTTGASCGAGVA